MALRQAVKVIYFTGVNGNRWVMKHAKVAACSASLGAEDARQNKNRENNTLGGGGAIHMLEFG